MMVAMPIPLFVLWPKMNKFTGRKLRNKEKSLYVWDKLVLFYKAPVVMFHLNMVSYSSIPAGIVHKCKQSLDLVGRSRAIREVHLRAKGSRFEPQRWQ
jgi:hypothetical protein